MAQGENPLRACSGFEWDDGNNRKNWERHQVTQEEAEDVFFNEPLVVGNVTGRSKGEMSYYALGHTKSGRRLFAAFAIRASLLRIISVRDMSRNERKFYAENEKGAST